MAERRRTHVAIVALVLALGTCSGTACSDAPDSRDSASTAVPAPRDGSAREQSPNGTAADHDPFIVATTRLPAAAADAAVTGLVGFDSCDALLADLKAEGSANLGPDGLNSRRNSAGGGSSGGGAGGSLALTGGSAPPEFSTTNTQEKAVDEPDTVKTDGSRIFTLSTRLRGSLDQPTLVTVDITGDGSRVDPRQSSSLLLPPEVSPSSLLLQGNHLLVIGSSSNAPPPPGEERAASAPVDPYVSRYPTTTLPGTPEPPDQTGRGAAELLLYDVSKPEPELISQISIAGGQVDARMIGGRVYLATSGNSIDERFVATRAQRSEVGALELNQRLLDSSTIDDWIPLARVTDRGQAPVVRPVVPCHRVSRPGHTRSFGVLSLLSFDLAATLSLGTADVSGFLTSSDLVYASPSTFVVKTSWSDTILSKTDPDRDADSLHVFDIEGGKSPSYQGSALIDGSVEDPYQISEWQGALRVASRKGTYENGSYVSSTSLLTFTLDPDGPHPAARIDDIGTTEYLTAVRFVGPLGYLTTARNIDPLHVIDLRDPRRPAITGELKIPGTSQYLHPIDDTLLLGIGSIYEPPVNNIGLGRNRFDAVLFDVADPTTPKEIQRATLDDVSSESQWDHRAFVWWPKTQTALFPLTSYAYTTAYEASTTMAKLHATRDGMSLTSSKTVASWSYNTRTVIVNDTLHILTPTDMMTADLDTLTVRDRLSFT